ncbi:hypothetical protein JHK84_038201 [Glycine max]|nr:hypothetical protein JHK85_038543 [Glycine max]KAG4978511.1 hypothetical protein JHK86_037985 [Glycine max]KAG5131804.1 hypothetical protein JHK84_038201 [Glycine max]
MRHRWRFDTYVVGKEDAPGIVVIQEWWGVDYEIKNHVVKISQLGSGFKALIPECCEGYHWLKANGSKKVGAAIAFYAVPASQLADPAQAKAPVQAHFGELDNYVGFSYVTAAKALEEKLKASGVPHEVHIYPGNAHAFMNRSTEVIQRMKNMGMLDEDEASVQLAWSRFETWMTHYLSC